jgi:hypothetical protein
MLRLGFTGWIVIILSLNVALRASLFPNLGLWDCFLSLVEFLTAMVRVIGNMEV